ncbi:MULTISPECIES: hypothetical protein [Morganellaceae]|uniref:Phage protein n=1 Tax=Proteus genomosp. 6 TaxID=1311820 RepID=A0ABV1LF09_9GAMM
MSKKFAVTDKVRIIQDKLGSNLVGYECEITSIDNNYELNIEVKFNDGTETFFSENELELISS